MHIVIDARTGDGTGISRYSLNLIRELEKLPGDTNNYTVLLGPHDFEHWKPTNKRFRNILAPYRHYGFGEQFGLLRLLYRLKPDLVHFTSFNAPLLYFGRRIFTIHDLTLIHFKNVRGGFWGRTRYAVKYWAMRLVLRCAVMRSSVLMAPSSFVKNDIVSHWRRDIIRTIAPSKITVTPEAAETHEVARQPRPLSEPYLLYVGATYPHKNVGVLLEAFDALRGTHPDLKLVMIGKRDYWQNQVRDQATAGVVFPGYVSNDQLAAYYQHAAAYVCPSLSEGFGLPPLEAMAYGAPVVSSNSSSLPEACGEAALYFDPTDSKALAEQLERLLNDDKLRQKLSEAGRKQAASFSWQRTAQQTHAVYDRALSKK